MDYEPDNDPENWRTINHAKVHLNGEGQIDGGAGGKFSGKAWTSEKHPHKSVKSSNGNGKMSTGGGGMSEKEAKEREWQQKWDNIANEREQKAEKYVNAGGEKKNGDVYFTEKDYVQLSTKTDLDGNPLSVTETVHASGDAEKAIKAIQSGKETSFKEAMKNIKGARKAEKEKGGAALNKINSVIKETKEKGSHGNIIFVNENVWEKGNQKRTYYKVNGLKNGGYYDHRKKVYVPGEVDLTKE